MKRVFLNFYLFIIFALLFVQFAINPLLQKAAEIYLHDSLVEYNQELSRGAFSLMEEFLLRFQKELWNEKVEDMKHDFGYGIDLLHINDIELDEEQMALIRSGKIGVDVSGDKLYSQIGDSGMILMKGPFEDLEPDTHMFTVMVYGIVIFALAVVTALWIIPYWLKLKKISQSAHKFGEGDLDSRVAISKSSTLFTIANSFNTMADKIQQLITSHKELTNAVSHELRTPLSRLRFGVEMLGTTNDDVKKKNYIEGLQSDVNDLEALIEELLTYARFDRESPELGKTDYQVVEIIEHVVHDYQVSYPDKKCSITSHLDGPLRPLADQKYMTRALANIIQNGFKYGNQRVNVLFERKGRNMRVIIEDDGAGIHEKYMHTIFEPFTRIDSSRSKISGGYGLGLAIAKKIVEWHEGRIRIEDSPLGGARFVIEWPGFIVEE